MALVSHGFSALNTYFLDRYRCTHTARCSVYLGLTHTHTHTHMHTHTDPLTHMDVLTRLMKGDHVKQRGVSGADKPPTGYGTLNSNCDQCDCALDQDGLSPDATPQIL